MATHRARVESRRALLYPPIATGLFAALLRPARQPQGIPTVGQFAATAHAEPDVTLVTGEAPDAAGIIAGNDAPVSLRYVSYDDRLTTDQMDTR